MAKKEIGFEVLLQAVVDGHKNNWSAQQVADYLGIYKEQFTPKLNTLRKTIKQSIPDPQKRDELLAMTQLRDCRGRPRVDPQVKIASLLSLLDKTEENEETES